MRIDKIRTKRESKYIKLAGRRAGDKQWDPRGSIFDGIPTGGHWRADKSLRQR